MIKFTASDEWYRKAGQDEGADVPVMGHKAHLDMQISQDALNIENLKAEIDLITAERDLARTKLQAANERIRKLEKVREEAWCTQDGNIPNSALNEALKACEEKEPT